MREKSDPTRLASPRIRGLARRESKPAIGDRAECHDRIDEVEDLPGTTATDEQPEATRYREDEREDDETLEAFRRRTGWRTAPGSPGGLGTRRGATAKTLATASQR